MGERGRTERGIRPFSPCCTSRNSVPNTSWIKASENLPVSQKERQNEQNHPTHLDLLPPLSRCPQLPQVLRQPHEPRSERVPARFFRVRAAEPRRQPRGERGEVERCGVRGGGVHLRRGATRRQLEGERRRGDKRKRNRSGYAPSRNSPRTASPSASPPRRHRPPLLSSAFP